VDSKIIERKVKDEKMQKKLSDKMWHALAALHIHTLSEVQEAAIPFLLQEKSMMLQAPTGTGKTYAFLLPILEKLDVKKAKTQALIMAPTRELASQIGAVLKELITVYDPNITHTLVIGGKDRERSMKELQTKQPHILIGTPGRCEDIIVKEGLVDTKDISFIVLDETDMMFENGFLESIDAIFETVKNHEVCYVVCSATISQEMRQFIKKYMTKNIEYIEVEKSEGFQAKTEYLLWDVTGKDRVACLEQVMDYYQPYLGLIFVNTKADVDLMYDRLLQDNYRIGVLHGNMKTRERAQMLKRIRQLEFQYVICSDIAARGIDIDGVSHVINYELPQDHALSFFHHRAGRTGRFKYQGTVFSLYVKSELPKIQKLIKAGIVFDHVKIANDTLIQQDDGKGRTRKQIDQELLQISKKAKAKANRAQKVKPGYKKKIRSEVVKSIKKEQKARKRAQIKKNKK